MNPGARADDLSESVAAENVVARVAVIGRQTLMPSIKPVVVGGRDQLVGHTYTEKVIDPAHELEYDVSDCTVFTVTHVGRSADFDVDDAGQALDLLDDSLRGISEVVLWERAHERMGKSSPFQRQVGRVDVKFFSIDGERASAVVWANPLYFTDLSGMAVMANFLGNVVMTNGPASNPLPPDAKRMMSAIDLVNLGFFTEAFVAAFALLDDLTQRVINGGLETKGFSVKQQQSFTRAIKEERLDHYLNNVTRLCDWVSLEDWNVDANRDVLKVNSMRNGVMHGDRELGRGEALWTLNVILKAIAFLRENPFGVPVTEFPPLRPAEPALVRLADPPPANGGDTDRDTEESAPD